MDTEEFGEQYAALLTICKSTQTNSDRYQTRSKGFDPKIPINKNRWKRNVIEDKSHWWNGPEIEYEISSTDYSTADRATIAAAFKHIEDRTCLRFMPRKSDSSKPYIYVGNNKAFPGCTSDVGLWSKNDKQAISLGPGCIHLGIVVHEIMHRLGFFHEQSRQDRDDFVTIFHQNVKTGSIHNFHKHESNYLRLPYDYHSVMHYDTRAFSKNGKPTIIPTKKNFLLGQRIGMSDIDAKKVNRLFGCRTRDSRYQRGLKEIESRLKKLNVPDLSKLPMFSCPEMLVSDKDCQDWKMMGYCGEHDIVAACPKLCSNMPSCRKWAGYGYCADKHLKYRMQIYCPCAC